MDDRTATGRQCDASWVPQVTGDVVAEGYMYDSRQTDHAWVEGLGILLQVRDGSNAPDIFEPNASFDELGWWPLDHESLNLMASGQAGLARKAVSRLGELEEMNAELVASILANTG